MNVQEIISTWQFAAALMAVGAVLIAIPFMMRPRTAVPAAAAPATAQPEDSSRVLSQVGFAEVNGTVVAFRSMVRQSDDLSDQQLAAFRRNLLSTSKEVA